MRETDGLPDIAAQKQDKPLILFGLSGLFSQALFREKETTKNKKINMYIFSDFRFHKH